VFGAALLIGQPISKAQQPAPNSTEDQSPTKNVPEVKLNAAAAALADIARLRRDYQQRLADAPPADRKQIADEGNDALEKAVTDKGLSVDEYNKILQVAQNDPDIREKLIQRAGTVKNQ
jgi:predicted ATPase with chaperone activity